MDNWKGTKGVWHVGQDSNVYDEKGFDILEMSSPYRIKENWEDTGASHWSEKKGISYIEITDEEVSANAHLIAAAPELLNVLLKMQKAINLMDYATIEGLYNEVEESINKALNK